MKSRAMKEKSPDVKAEPIINVCLQQRREGFGARRSSTAGTVGFRHFSHFVIHLNLLYPQKQRRKALQKEEVGEIQKDKKKNQKPKHS